MITVDIGRKLLLLISVVNYYCWYRSWIITVDIGRELLLLISVVNYYYQTYKPFYTSEIFTKEQMAQKN